MRELIFILAMLHPVEYKHESHWWGLNAYQLGNTRGDVLKAIVWQNGSIQLEVGRWNRLIVSARIW